MQVNALTRASWLIGFTSPGTKALAVSTSSGTEALAKYRATAHKPKESAPFSFAMPLSSRRTDIGPLSAVSSNLSNFPDCVLATKWRAAAALQKLVQHLHWNLRFWQQGYKR